MEEGGKGEGALRSEEVRYGAGREEVGRRRLVAQTLLVREG